MSRKDAALKTGMKNSGHARSRSVTMQPKIGGYAKRRIRFLRYWKRDGNTFKVYGITVGAVSSSPALVDAALQTVALHLSRQPTKHQSYGVGFVSLHEGQGENQIIIDRWINENELLHEIYVSSPKVPGEFRLAPRDHNSVCVWELYLQGFERKAWLGHVLCSNAAWPRRLKKYLGERLDTRV
jgi:hypothetical protein